jgi:hypothetical protein
MHADFLPGQMIVQHLVGEWWNLNGALNRSDDCRQRLYGAAAHEQTGTRPGSEMLPAGM